tara:strand:- start:4061 stop:4225 length:165 start_codon:yes stop_codon:yes gene_type:complete
MCCLKKPKKNIKNRIKRTSIYPTSSQINKDNIETDKDEKICKKIFTSNSNEFIN